MDDSSITAPAPASTSVPPGLAPFIHLCDALVVADKPSGLLSVPGRGPERADCLAARVQAVLPDARVVHRLDMSTSGLMLMARGAQAQRVVSRAFEQRRVDKRYVAVVQGLVRDDVGEIDLPLIVDWPNRPRQCIDHVVGKPSLTRWQVLLRDVERQRTRLALQPITGRSHQLRVHLWAIGHPIFGDDLYAPPQVCAAEPRLLLHAHRLAIDHPVTGERLSFVCDVPF